MSSLDPAVAPVQSVAGRTGAVVLSSADTGGLPAPSTAVSAWVASTSYPTVGQFVINGGYVWSNKTAHTSGVTFSGSTNWVQIGAALAPSDGSAPISLAQASTGLSAAFGPRFNVVFKTAAYTAVDGDVVVADTTAASFTVTLPASVAGRIIGIRKGDASANVVTVATATGTIDGLAARPYAYQYQTQKFVCDGTNWQRLDVVGVTAMATTGTPSATTYLRGDGSWTAPGSLAPAWTPNTTYAASQLVVYLSALYLRNTAGAGGTTFDVTQWTVLTSAQSVVSGTTPPDAPGVTYVVVTAPAAPGQVTALTATPGSGQVALSWTAPANGGSAITDYVVQYRTPSGSGSYTTFTHAAQTGTTITVTGLTNGSAYGFTVAAVNAAGTGVASAETVATPSAAATAPGQVTGLSSTPTSTSVALTWTAPASNGGSAITDYFVEYRTGAAAFAAFTHSASTAATQTVTGLTAATSYDFRVSAVNAVGTGTASTVYTVATSAATANNLPLADTFVRANQTGIGTPSDGKTAYTVVGAFNIVSNAAASQTATGDTALRDTGVANMKVSVDLIGASASSSLNILVRSDATGQNCYNININTAHVILYKRVAGAYTQIGATNTTTTQNGGPQTFTVNINGSTITITRDAATLVFTATDTSITTGTFGGARTEDNTTYTFKNLNMVTAT